MDKNPNFVSFILLVKLKPNKDHVYGINWVLVNTVNFFNIYYILIRFFTKFILTKRKRPPLVIFQLDVVHNWPNKLPLKSMDEILSPSVA
jgi:hypothetical protein